MKNPTRSDIILRTSYIVSVVVALLVILGIVQVVRPVAPPTVSASVPASTKIAGTSPALPWPQGVQADVGVSPVGVWPQHGPSQAEPIGSLAKMMTAYLVLKAHPLSQFQNGPTLTVTTADVQLLQQDANSHQSVLPVAAGEKISERTLLEGLLVPSGNNAATMLAQWVGGSVSQFTAEMNAEAKTLGLNNTHFNGPVGLSAATVSTAADQMKLASIIMENPVVRQIVAMPQLTTDGQLVYNYNYLIGHQGITGVKTGSTTQSGGCVVLSTEKTVGGHALTIYASVLGQPATSAQGQVWAALDAANALLKTTDKAVGEHAVVTQGEVFGHIDAGWQSPIPLVAAKSATLVGWPGMSYTLHLTTHVPQGNTMAAGTVVGTLTVHAGSQTITVPVKTAESLKAPTYAYRLKR